MTRRAERTARAFAVAFFLGFGVGYSDAIFFPDDHEWLGARWTFEVLRDHPELRKRVYGDTPLFPLFMEFFERSAPFVAAQKSPALVQ